MENVSTSSDCNTNQSIRHACQFDSGLQTKIRRLKIEENLLTNSISKFKREFQTENGSYSLQWELKDSDDYSGNLKKSFMEIRNLFDEIKNNTHCDESLKVLDIDEVKKDVLQLDKKIKAFKLFVQSELTSLKIEEEELEKQMNNPDEVEKIKKRPKFRPIPITEIVPSPVKNLINSPFKYAEVQQFQEFMSNRKNRYGGWIPYNHNIFVKCWEKHVILNDDDDDISDNDPENLHNFQLFANDIYHKIAGITMDNIIEHSKWYLKFLFLRNRQQKALLKWKNNKYLIKNAKRKIKPSEDIVQKKQDKSPNDDKKIKVKASNLTFRRPDQGNKLVGYSYNDQEGVQDMNVELSARISSVYDELIKEHENLLEDIANENISLDISLEDNATVDVTVTLDGNASKPSKRNEEHQRYMKPTSQWQSRCNYDSCIGRAEKNVLNVDNLSKLHVPVWRRGLKY